MTEIQSTVSLVNSIKKMFLNLERKVNESSLDTNTFKKFEVKLLTRLESLTMQESSYLITLDKVKQKTNKIEEYLIDSDKDQIKNQKQMIDGINIAINSLKSDVLEIFTEETSKYEQEVGDLKTNFLKSSDEILNKLSPMHELLKEFNNIIPSKNEFEEQHQRMSSVITDSLKIIQENTRKKFQNLEEKIKILATQKTIIKNFKDIRDYIDKNESSNTVFEEIKSNLGSILSNGDRSLLSIKLDTKQILQNINEKVPNRKEIEDLKIIANKFNSNISPLIKKLPEDLKNEFSRLINSNIIGEIKKGFVDIKGNFKSLASYKSVDDLRRICEIKIPQIIETSNKESLRNNRDINVKISEEKEKYAKIQEKLLRIENLSNILVKNSDLVEFKESFEKIVGVMRQELRVNLTDILKSSCAGESSNKKILENIRLLNQLTPKINEIGLFLSDNIYQKMDKELSDISLATGSLNSQVPVIAKNLELLLERAATEKSLKIIKEFTSPEGFKSLVNSIKMSMLPELTEYLKNKPDIEYFDKIQTKNESSHNQILNRFEDFDGKIAENQSNLENIKVKLTGLAVKEDLVKFQEIIRAIVETEIPVQLEKLLADVAKQQIITQKLDDLGGYLKDLIKTDTLIEETAKRTQDDLHEFKNSAEIKLVNANEILDQVLINTSSEIREHMIDQIRSLLLRTAKEDTVFKLNEMLLKSFGDFEENFGNIGKSLNKNERTSESIIKSLNDTVTHENLADFGQLFFNEIKQKLTEDLNTLSKYTAKENTLDKIIGILNDNLKDLPKGDEIVELKSGQDKITKSFIKMAGKIKEISESSGYLESQINAVSEKITLLFEFIKRVSGI
ncbi:MAG: hypothetical protein ACTSWY_06055 [Promethearchaeota archaeon]